MANLPQGTVTFLFSDIEGSTRLAQRLGSQYTEVLERHQRIVRAALGDGVEISTAGDSFFVAFDSAISAVEAAVTIQRDLARHEWPSDATIRVRIGLHTGQASVSNGDYIGIDVHRAARIAAAGHGGQVLVSESMHALTSRQLPDGITARDLGRHRLKDLSAPERLFDLVIAGLPAEFPPLVTLDDHRTNLPIQLTSFVGREREMDELRELAGANRLMTVIGAGGTGKTRLALQVAGELIDAHPDGVWLVELAPVTSPELVAQEVARTLSVQDEPGRTIEQTLVDFVRLKRLLVLLDNCEHVIGSVASLVATLFRSAPSIAVLATSREALGIAGEVVYQLPSMRVPPPAPDHDDHDTGDGGRLVSVGSSESVRLFVERATSVEPSFALSADNVEAIGDICRRLDGIPLAIELAAARVTLLSVQDIDARLGDRFRLLTGGSRTALPRQQTLQALIDWSWDLLEEPDRRLLRHLSVFVGGATLEAVTAVTGKPELETLEGIGRLVDRSLVLADRGSPARYRLLETIRQYGRERLVAAGDVAERRNAHLGFYLDLAERADVALRGPDMMAWLQRLDDDVENLRSAIEWAFETDAEAALRLALAMALYWRTHSMLEGFDRMREAAELAARVPTDDRDGLVLRSRVLAAAGNLAWLTGNAPIGLPWARRSTEIAAALDDRRARYEAIDTLAMTLLFTGEDEGVLELAREAIELAKEEGDWFTIAFTEAGLAQWDAETGRIVDAEERIERASFAANRSGNQSLKAFVALSQGRAAGFSGRLQEARQAFARAIAGYAQTGDARLELVARSDFAHALRMGGEIAEAEAIYRDTLHAWMHAGNRGAIANQLESFGFLAVNRGVPARAAKLFGAASAIRAAADAPMLPFERGQYDEARAAARGEMTRAEFDAAWAEGATLTIDEAVAYALDQAGR